MARSMVAGRLQRVGVVIGAAQMAVAMSAVGAHGSDDPDPLKSELVDAETVISEAIPSEADVGPLDNAQRALADISGTKTATAWTDPGTGAITVGITADVDADKARVELAAHGILDVELERVANSREDLDAVIEDAFERPELVDVSSAIHDYAGNRIVLTSRVEVTDDLRIAVRAAFGDAAVIADQPLAIDAASREEDSSPFYAGAWTGRSGGHKNCTLGWSWVTPGGDARMLTAGHCYPAGTNGSVATNYGSGNYAYQVGRVIGTTVGSAGSVGSDGDLALVDTTTTWLGTIQDRKGAPRMWIGGPSSSTSTTVNSVDRWTANGTHICYSGMARGVQCGRAVDSDGDGGYTVADKDYSYRDANGDRYTHVALATKGWGKCPVGGDSGAPVYINTAGTGVAAHGILSGGGGGGSDNYVAKFEPSSCKMVFTEIGQAYERWAGHVETY